jgi:hypothetical protein
MSRFTPDRLYELLPSVYRVRDEQMGWPLKALLAVIAEQAKVVEDDIDGLYENWFIETCADWLVPYIGDLVGVRGLGLVREGTFSLRPHVANTIRYRRRKGTATMLEQLASGTTGWRARAVEFFEYLGTTQNLNHLRPGRGGTVSLRLQKEELELLGTAFDTLSHTVETRRADTQHGKYSVPDIGLFLWRLQAYPLRGVQVFPHGAGRFSFSPLGNDIRLFNLPQPEPDISHLAEEANVPAPLRRRALSADLKAQPQERVYFGETPVLAVEGYSANQLVICDLSAWQANLGAGQVAVDPELGRLAFPASAAVPSPVKVSYAYGFGGALGGGPYDRRKPASSSGEPDTVAHPEILGCLIQVSSTTAGLQGALDSVHDRAVIQIEDSLTCSQDFSLDMNGRTELVIQAANRQRPVLAGSLIVKGGTGSESLTLNGLLISGDITVLGDLARLRIVHCTLVPGLGIDEQGMPTFPGQPSIIAGVGAEKRAAVLQLEIDHSITGPLRVAQEMERVCIRDSIVDALSLEPVQALASGELSSINITSPSPSLMISIGRKGPFVARLPEAPATLEAARRALEAAIKRAHTSPAFQMARVVVAGNRLAILPGIPGAVQISSVKGDPTARQLRLIGTSAQKVQVRLSRPLWQPQSTVLPARKSESSGGPDLLLARAERAQPQLPSSLRSTSGSRLLTVPLENRFVVFPSLGLSGKALHLPAGGFWHALAADENGNPGPPVTIEHATILGEVHAKELEASEAVFTHAVRVQRRQEGCLRFCYLPDQDSTTAPRFACQPDLALQLQERAGIIDPFDRDRLRSMLEPLFTSIRYGDPGYAQLDASCHPCIRTGGEDGTEMGAFHFLEQPQREANLRAALDEYLRVELVAGLFFVT